MERLLLVGLVILGAVYIIGGGIEGAAAVLVSSIVAVVGILLIQRNVEDKAFIRTWFYAALLLRLALGFVIWKLDLFMTFGPDAITYDSNGYIIMMSWISPEFQNITNRAGEIGYGMVYLVSIIYFFVGRSILTAQAFCGVIGALTIPMVYLCGYELFRNKRVAQFAAIGVAVFPSFIIWSSQLLKDGLIVFLLVAIMVALLNLQKERSYGWLTVIVFCLAGIVSLRFYIFYMVLLAVIVSIFSSGMNSVGLIARNIAAAVLVAVIVSYSGIVNPAVDDVISMTDLEEIQFRREALSAGSGSGFVKETDITTTAGALTALPVGFIYLMFSPFPWEATKLTQMLVIPETLIWWALIPLAFTGTMWVIRNKLSTALPVLVFSLMLTIGYTIFQGNVGMAYRQRTQIQVFLFMSVSVGISLILEKRENDKLVRSRTRQRELKKSIERGKQREVNANEQGGFA